MSTRIWIRIAMVAAGVAVAAGLVCAGRASVDTSAARDQGYAAGRSAGEADGVRVGRALQATQSLPPDLSTATRDAFNAGYVAGANDVFNLYDGGWDVGVPYLVVLTPADGGITYRIDTRTPLRPGVDYYLCPQSQSLCQRAR